MSVAVVTDSTSDIPPTLAQPLGISIVPAVIVIAGQEYEDGEGITREAFYRRLPDMAVSPTTAAPSSGSFAVQYRRLFDDGADQILSIHVSSKLSAIFNAAHIAAKPFEGRVIVIDSGQVSMGLGYQAMAAAKKAREGASLDEIQYTLVAMRPRIRLVAMLDTLKYLQRSGRVSWVRANLGAFLQVKPFVGVREGEVLRMGQVRTRKKGFNQLLDTLESLGPLEKLAVLHTNAPREAHRLFEAREFDLVEDPIFINVTSVIGSHVGPNGLGFACVLAET